MTNANTASSSEKGLPSVSDLYVKALHLNGLAVALNELDPYDARTRAACSALRDSIERMSSEMSDDLAKLDDVKEAQA